MTPPSVERRDNGAINTVKHFYYAHVGDISNPNSIKKSKPENAGPIRSNIIDTFNATIHYLHDFALNSVMHFSPSPNEKDLLSYVVEEAPNAITRATPLILQITKSPATLFGIAALCGAAIMTNPHARDEIATDLNKITHNINNAGEKVGRKIIKAAHPTIPISLATLPVYKKIK